MLLAAAMRPDLVGAIVLVSGGPWFSGERDGVTAGLAGEFLAFLASRAAEGASYADICEQNDPDVAVRAFPERRRRSLPALVGASAMSTACLFCLR